MPDRRPTETDTPPPSDPIGSPLPRSFYDRPTVEVARDLLGCRIARLDGSVLRLGRIVETEAYLGVLDRACHSSKGRTARTEVMFGPPGFAYVYIVYGMHHCLNAVTRAEGEAEAVLIRALEPLEACLGAGSGPGLVCKALSIDRDLNGVDLTDAGSRAPLLVLPPAGRPVGSIAKGPRVGVDYAGPAWSKRLLRFWEVGSQHVSPALGARRGAGTRAKPRGMRAP
ncbi:MAG: DNA-3-methyladenine glycosylase [Myxococcales bacterium]